MATILATTLATGTFLSGCGQDSGSESGRQSEMSQNESAENSGTDSKAETSSEAGTDTEANVSDGACQTTYGDKQFDNVTITVEIFDRSNAPEGSTITDNKWTKYAQEEMGKVGINVEYVAVPRNDETTKIYEPSISAENRHPRPVPAPRCRGSRSLSEEEHSCFCPG